MRAEVRRKSASAPCGYAAAFQLRIELESKEIPTTRYYKAGHRTRGQRDYDSSTWTTPTFVVRGIFPELTLLLYQRNSARKVYARVFGAVLQGVLV